MSVGNEFMTVEGKADSTIPVAGSDLLPDVLSRLRECVSSMVFDERFVPGIGTVRMVELLLSGSIREERQVKNGLEWGAQSVMTASLNEKCQWRCTS